MSAYLFQQIVQRIQGSMDGVGINRQNPALYNAILSNVQTQGSPIQNNLLTFLNMRTNGQWQNGMIPEPQLIELLRTWLNDVMPKVDQQIRQQGMMQQPQSGYGGYQPPQQSYQQPQGGYYQPPAPLSAQTASLYEISGTPQPQQQAPAPAAVDQSTTIPERDSSMEVDTRPITIRLNPEDTLQHVQKEGNVVSVDNYREGDYNSFRLSTIDIKLNVSENMALVAADKALTYAPNEVIRGLYANVVSYKELHHIPMKTADYKRIAERIGAVFYTTKGAWDWRAAVAVISELKRDEYRAVEKILLKFLNPAIFKYLRLANGDVIEGIEELDDLQELDDPRSQLKVTRNSRYMNVFNEIVMRSFDHILNPKNLIGAEDPNFGDFVHCSKIEFWYDERSKYDYGTYPEKVDRMRFIEMMMEKNAVLRVDKIIIVTNALDSKMVNNITYFRGRDMVNLTDTNHVGCKLLLELDQTRRSEIEAVICIEKETGSVINSRQINLGRIVEGDLVLIR